MPFADADAAADYDDDDDDEKEEEEEEDGAHQVAAWPSFLIVFVECAHWLAKIRFIKRRRVVASCACLWRLTIDFFPSSARTLGGVRLGRPRC